MVLAKQVIVAKTRQIRSNWCMVKCADGDCMIHVDNMPRYKDIDFKNLTCDEAEKAMRAADRNWKKKHKDENRT